MKIVVTAGTAGLDGPVDTRFGRAASFVLYDTETQESRLVDNTQNLNAAQGAGIQAAQTVAALGAEAVITGHCGPKAFRVLKTAGVRIFTGATGRVADAIVQYQAGHLQELLAADTEGHWV